LEELFKIASAKEQMPLKEGIGAVKTLFMLRRICNGIRIANLRRQAGLQSMYIIK